jgi:hypothetical protein
MAVIDAEKKEQELDNEKQKSEKVESETDVLHDEMPEGEEDEEVAGKFSDYLTYEEWRTFPEAEKIDRYFELSEEDQIIAYNILTFDQRIKLLTEDQKQIYERLKDQMSPLTYSVRYARHTGHTYDLLRQGTDITFGKNKVDERVRIVKAIRTTGGSSITYFGISNSSDHPAVKGYYKQAIEFYPNSQEHFKNSRLLEYTKLENKKLYKPSLSSDTCRVSCTCNNYYYAFSMLNFENGCKYGRAPEEYVKKSIRDLSKVRNPRKGHNVSGVCKHLVAFIEGFLRSYNLVED